MAKPTERAIKRKPMAVIMLTTLRKDVPEVPPAGKDFEWFDTEQGRKQFFTQVHDFNVQDAKDHDDMAYLTVEITDTATMKVGRIEVAPSTEATDEWLKAVKADITKALTPIKEPSSEGSSEKKVVRPRRKSTAAQAVHKDDEPNAKAARLKERLAAKKTAPATKKSETGDKPPTKKAAAKKAPAKKAPAKRTSAAKEPEFVVTKAAVDSKKPIEPEAGILSEPSKAQSA